VSIAFDVAAGNATVAPPGDSAKPRESHDDSRRAALAPRLSYWIFASLLTLYVALTTGYRDELIAADAWEHHRAIRVLAEVGLHAGNPTQAASEPSIRYSPYTVALAVVSRSTHLDSYDVLSAAATVNTALLFVSLYAFLCSYRREVSCVWILGPMLFLYGAAPAYANSLALEDLPWLQVNPSAFSLWVSLFAWATWRWAETRAHRLFVAIPLCGGLIGCATLSHGMTGMLGGVGLLAVSMARRDRARVTLLGATALTLALAGGLCVLWPWYSFLTAVRSSPDAPYWYNPFILRRMLFVWCFPAWTAAMTALPYRRDDLVRTCLWGLGASLALGAAAIAIHSVTLARLPLAGLIFAQILTGYALWQWDLLNTRSLRATLDFLRSFDPAAFAAGFVRLLLPAAILYFAVPQVWNVLHEPHLLRPRIASLLGKDTKRSHLLENYRHVLSPVAETDVVLGDLLTAWPVPSVRGRIVGAEHLEFFVPGQRERCDSAQAFFETQTGVERRREILQRYHVRWLLLDRERDAEVLIELLIPSCVVAERASLVLLDAPCWAEQSSNSLKTRGRS
jgi:hypothetical protein